MIIMHHPWLPTFVVNQVGNISKKRERTSVAVVDCKTEKTTMPSEKEISINQEL
jgi:hypothetical protein